MVVSLLFFFPLNITVAEHGTTWNPIESSGGTESAPEEAFYSKLEKKGKGTSNAGDSMENGFTFFSFSWFIPTMFCRHSHVKNWDKNWAWS